MLKQAIRRAAHAGVGSATILVYAAVVVPLARWRRSRRVRAGLKPAVLWGPIPVINLRYCALASRAYGYPSDSLVYDVYRINARQTFDYVLSHASRVPIVRELVPYAAFLWAGLRYDIFGFFFDGGLLWATPFWRVELRLLRL